MAVHPFETATAGPLALQRYVGACRILHQAGLPLVGLHTGTVGLLLMALGAVGGIESGITDGETFDVSQRLQRPRPQQGKPMGVQVRIYLRTLQTFLTTKEAESFFATRGTTGQHICQGQDCCRRGVRDMLTYPVLHFVSSRAAEVRRLSEFPRHRRAGFYLDETLRPASDKVVKVSRAHPRLARVRDRLDTWHQACTAILDQDGGQVRSVAAAPTGRRLRTRRAV